MSLFTRAAAGYALSASERSLLRLIKSFLVAACVATWPVLNSFLTAVTTSDLHIDYSGWLANLAKAFVVALALAVQKYFSAQADTGKAATKATILPKPSAAAFPVPSGDPSFFGTDAPPPPPATTAPASPSYAPVDSTGSYNATAAVSNVTLTPPPPINTTAANAPQPTPAADTPTQVVAKVADTTPAPTQAATDAT